jgi:hypothetical protein
MVEPDKNWIGKTLQEVQRDVRSMRTDLDLLIRAVLGLEKRVMRCARTSPTFG